jgi:hypothetical protein
MLDAIEIVVPNHPKARERNKFDAPVDVKTHDWIHTNVKFVGTAEQYAGIYSAFKGTTPFTDLGYKAQADCPTHTISRWSVRECPVAKYDGDSLWVAFESRGSTPYTFLQHVADTHNVTVVGTHLPVYSMKWKQTTYSKGNPPLTSSYGRYDTSSAI